MDNNRDDFTKKTVEILAKRVGYLCSNPNCRKLTIGANEDIDKSTTIGIAAHITAAASGGPRFDENLSPEQRKYIENGIWLCSNCASLIDKDEKKYPTKLIKGWKEEAEIESYKKLSGEFQATDIKQPYLEVDLVWKYGGRWNRGYSLKNITETHEGREVIMAGALNIIHWDLDWNYNFVIYNNSNYPAYNVKIESVGEGQFSSLTKLSKINNIPPLKNIDLEAKFNDHIESNHIEADEMLLKRFPDKLDNVILKITYEDDNRKEHCTMVTFNNNNVTNQKQ